MNKSIERFFSSEAYAVVGASNNREKFGNKVLRCYLQHKKVVFAVNPNETQIEGAPCFQRLKDLPLTVNSISIVTPPEITKKIVDQAIVMDIKNIWMQPGAESDEAIQKCKDNGINIIANGPCILQELGYKDN